MMKRSLPILNYADIISQTMSFTIAYTWRESIRDFVKDLCPQSLISGPVGAIIFCYDINNVYHSYNCPHGTIYSYW